VARRAWSLWAIGAQELIDGAFITLHLTQDQRKELREQRVRRLRPQALGESRGVGEIIEKHRDLFPFAFKGTAGGKDLLR
jgi:hypothetical protein